jgi:DNA adenine methylase
MPTYREPFPYPFLKWVGGKRQLLPELLKAVEVAGTFRHYHEPFLGGGALFFALARTGQLEGRAYLSDLNQNLMDAWLGVRDHVDQVVRILKEHRKHHSEAYFYRLRDRVPRTLATRAARIIYLNKTCYNGLYRENSKGRFNAPFGRYANPRICDEDNLRAVSAALGRARLDTRHFRSVLKYARRGDLVYFDPPYVPLSKTADFTSYSKEGFGAGEQAGLADVFARLANRGVKVVLTNSMTDYTVELYREFYVYQVLANRVVNSRADSRGKVAEALVTSFPIADKRRLPTRNQRQAGIERIPTVDWLRANGYEDVADLIAEVVDDWKAEGKRTRRNWWEVLAGDGQGQNRSVAGRTFPILRVAQIRQGVPVSEDAICRNPKEEAPPILVTGRWSLS